MHTRYILILISLLMIFHIDLCAMLVTQKNNDTGPHSPDSLTQPLERKQHQRILTVLNGHSTCTDPYVLLEKGARKYQKNKIDEAQIFWEHVLRQPHGDKRATALAWYYLGHAYNELDQPDNTRNAWEEAAKQDNDFFTKADALYNLYVLYSIEEKKETALQKYETLKALLFNTQHTEDDPFHEADALFYLSRVCEVGGELDEAIKYYDMTRLLVERIGWGEMQSDTATRIQAFKYLINFAQAEGDEQTVKSYQQNITYLLNPPENSDFEDTFE